MTPVGEADGYKVPVPSGMRSGRGRHAVTSAAVFLRLTRILRDHEAQNINSHLLPQATLFSFMLKKTIGKMPFLTKQTEEIFKTEGKKLFLKAKTLFSLWMSHFL